MTRIPALMSKEVYSFESHTGAHNSLLTGFHCGCIPIALAAAAVVWFCIVIETVAAFLAKCLPFKFAFSYRFKNI
jgi:hypothetical protein